jgi:probable F420-dependent oxidoreductase
MKIYTTVPVADPLEAGPLFRGLEDIGYDGAFTFETKHDPFLPLAVAAGETQHLRLGTAIAIGFARNPMTLANVGYDLHRASRGRFILGLGSQIRPHITNRYGMPWSHPARRMREMVGAIRCIWKAWQGEAALAFRGDFYRHTLMTPAFDPGPNPFGTAKIFTAGVGPRMTEVAGEVADGFFVHPFSTRKSLLELTLPAVQRGLERSGRRRQDVEIVCVQLVATGRTGAEIEVVKQVIRKQLAFYASTPAYRPVLACHGWEDLQPELNELSKRGRWDDMAALVSNEMIETIAVVTPRHEMAAAILRRVQGIADGISLENTRAPDATNFADVVKQLQEMSS